MRAENIFKFAHLSVFIAGIGVGVFGLALVSGQAAFAQEVGDDEGEDEGYYPEVEDNVRDIDLPKENDLLKLKRFVFKPDRKIFRIPNGKPSNPGDTSSISDAIGESAGFCGQLVDERYRIDCVGERLLALARAMPTTGEYAEAREVLIEAGEKIRALARANRAPNVPVAPAVGKVNNATVRTSPLVPVKRESIKQVSQQAADILQEAETKLLRAAAASDRRLIAYAQIAKAVGSNKKLLRSA